MKQISYAALLFFLSQMTWALDYPQPSKPEQRAVIERFKTDYARMNERNFFTAPNPEPAWPCEVDQTQQYKAAGFFWALPENVRKLDKETRRHMRQVGMDPDSYKMTWSLDKFKAIPLRAQCSNGKLDGEVEALIEAEYTMHNQSEVNIGGKVQTINSKTTTSGRHRIISLFKAGESIGISADLGIDNMTISGPVNTKTTMPRIIYSTPNDSKGMTSTLFVQEIPKMNPLGLGFSMVSTLNTTFASWLDDERMIIENYLGKRYSGYQNQKNGRLHGEQIMYMENMFKGSGMRLDQMPGMENARIIQRDGEELIEQSWCWQDGQQLKTKECPQ